MAELWRWRRLVGELARRDFKARYAGSALGAVWAILEPLIQFAVYLTIFSFVLGMRLEGRPGVGAFGLYLITGLMPFLAFQEALMRAVGLAHAQANLVRHVGTPLEVLVAGGLGAILARHAIGYALALVAAAAAGMLAWAQLPWLAAGVALLVVACWGGSLLFLAAGAYLPDLSQLLGVGLMVLFYVTPIVYTERYVPGALRPWLKFNPLVGALDAFRAGITGAGPSLVKLGIGAAGAGLLLAVGSGVFRLRYWAIRDIV
jgi:ABC-type polysaccharide/polyol phosphate export permease